MFPRLHSRGRVLRAAALCAALFAAAPPPARAQGLTGIDRERGQVMLKQIKSKIKDNYYDPTFHGVDLEAKFKAADEMLKQATSLGQMFGIIAQAVMSLNDSHTIFVPPAQTVRAEYGWEMQAIGESSYVSAVKPGSDAEAKGLKPGDLVLEVNGIPVKRSELWKFHYLYYTLRPQAGMLLTVRSPGGQPRRVEVLAKVRNDKRALDFTGADGGADIHNTIRDIERSYQLRRHRHVEAGEELMIWKMPQFDLSIEEVDRMMDKARKRKALVLDLRGNGGGSELTMLRLIGNLFDRDVTVGEMKRRKEAKTLVAKTRGANAFAGQLVVLVDSESGSAAEVLARVVQLEKRGTVVGDRTSGKVMRSRYHSEQMGMDTAVFWGVAVTDADLIMADGKSLEHTGVTPDVLMLPEGADLAAKRDPVLAHAASLAGLKLDPEKAGALFPREWRK
jgi:C-terminal processing protease CtpA/Prc